MKFVPSPLDKVEALLCANLALVMFVGVCSLMIREPLEFKQDKYDLEQRKFLSVGFLPVALILGGLAAYSIYWLMEYLQTEATFTVQDMRTGARAMTATNGYFFAAGWMLSTIVALIAYFGRFSLISVLPFLTFMLFRFATGQRGAAVAAVVIISLLYLYDQRRRWPTLFVIVALIPAVWTFDAVQKDRGMALRQVLGFEVNEIDIRRYSVERDDERFLESMDIAMLEMVEFLTWSVPEKSGSYDYFLGNLQILTEPIPRVLWPDKPIGAPIRLFDLYSHATTINGVMSAPSMGWMYWGYPLAIWAAVFALIYGTAYKSFARSRQSNIAVAAYIVFLSTAVVAFRDGLILTILKQSLFYLVLLVGLMIVAA